MIIKPVLSFKSTCEEGLLSTSKMPGL